MNVAGLEVLRLGAFLDCTLLAIALPSLRKVHRVAIERASAEESQEQYEASRNSFENCFVAGGDSDGLGPDDGDAQED
jgi:hypothetical protein